MPEVTQHAQLSVDPEGRDDVLEDIGHLLEGDTLAIPGIRHCPDNEQRSTTEHPFPTYKEVVAVKLSSLILSALSRQTGRGFVGWLGAYT